MLRLRTDNAVAAVGQWWNFNNDLCVAPIQGGGMAEPETKEQRCYLNR